MVELFNASRAVQLINEVSKGKSLSNMLSDIDKGRKLYAQDDERWNVRLGEEAQLLVGFNEREDNWRLALTQGGRQAVLIGQRQIAQTEIGSNRFLKRLGMTAVGVGAAATVLTSVVDRISSPDIQTSVSSTPITYPNPNPQPAITQPDETQQAEVVVTEPVIEEQATESAIRQSYFHLYGPYPDSDPIHMPSDPNDPAVIAEVLQSLSLEHGIDPGIVFALVNLQRDDNALHGFTLDKVYNGQVLSSGKRIERKGLGLLTREEFKRGIRYRIQEDIDSGKVPAQEEWYAIEDSNDNALAVVELLKNGQSFISLQESASAIIQLSKDEKYPLTDLGGGYHLVHTQPSEDSSEFQLIKKIVAQQEKATSPSVKPIVTKETSVSGDQVKQAVELLVARYFGPLGVDLNFVSNIVLKESNFNPNAVNGPYTGLMQINGELHRELIEKIYGSYNQDMLKSPETNMRVAAELYKDSKKRTGQGFLPWGFAMSVISLNGRESTKVINIGKGWLPRQAVLSSLDLRRLDPDNKLIVAAPPANATLEERIAFRERAQEQAGFIKNAKGRLATWVEVAKDSTKTLGGQTVSNRDIDNMIRQIDARWRDDIMPSDMRYVVSLATELVENEAQREALRNYYLGFEPDDKRQINQILDAVSEVKVLKTIAENYRTPEEIRRSARKDAMKLMKKRAEDLLKRKVDWYSLRKDEMLQIALSLAEDRSLDSFTNLIPKKELSSSNRTNRRLSSSWARHQDLAQLMDEDTKTRASLLMKEMLKTQSRSKAAKDSYLRRKRIKQAEVEAKAGETITTKEEVAQPSNGNPIFGEIEDFLRSYRIDPDGAARITLRGDVKPVADIILPRYGFLPKGDDETDEEISYKKVI